MERGIGQWKRRFHVLHSEIRVTPPAKVCKIIFVCAVLHNICKDRNIEILLEGDEHGQPPEEEMPMVGNEDGNHGEALRGGQRHGDGLFYRDEFARLHFK